MVAIGTCDFCGEFCSEVGVEPAESFALPSGWVPTSAIERHRKWSKRRYECADNEGHRGPLHDARGRRLDRCRHCYSPTHESGGWDSTLDHSRCPECEVRAWHGVVVPDWVVRDPASITPELIDAERNTEVRRVMVERFGVERLMRESGGEVIHEDATGRLWRRLVGPPPRPPARSWGQWMAHRRRPHPPAEYLTIVEVRNATPEPDGTTRTYFLRVPPETRTARQGVAWTFGMTEHEYAPTAET